MAKYTHEELKSLVLNDFNVQKEYDDLDDAFKLLKETLKARIQDGKTQEDVAETLYTKVSTIN